MLHFKFQVLDYSIAIMAVAIETHLVSISALY